MQPSNLSKKTLVFLKLPSTVASIILLISTVYLRKQKNAHLANTKMTFQELKEFYNGLIISAKIHKRNKKLQMPRYTPTTYTLR